MAVSKRYRFAAGQALPAGATFARDAATVDALGAAVAANAPRFGHTEYPAPVPVVESVSGAGSGSRLTAGAGYAADNETPLAIIRHTTNNTVVVWSGGVGSGTSTTATLTEIGETDLFAFDPDDITGGIAGHRYLPKCFNIALGVISASCEVYREVESEWTVVRFASLRSIDNGATWTVEYEDDEDDQVGVNRVGSWSEQNWWTRTRNAEGGGEVLDLFRLTVNYCEAGGGDGGKAILVRQTRATVEDAWTFGAPIVVHEFTGPTHMHPGGVVFLEGSAMGVVLSIGDSTPRNAVVLMVCDDEDEYDDPGHWTTNESYHGVRSPSDDSESEPANQFVGVGPGPLPNQLFVGVDEKRDFIQLLTVSTNPADVTDRAEFSAVTSWQSFYLGMGSTALGARVFHIHCERPEVAKEWIATYTTGSTSSIAEGSRIIYYNDGKIAQVAAPLRGGSTWKPFLSDGFIYFDSGSPAATQRMAVVSLAAGRRPLLIGKGGTNKIETGITVTGLQTGATAVKLDANDIAALVAAGMPEPPAQGEVWRITSDKTGRIFSSGGGFNLADSAVMTAGDFSLRSWVLSLPWSKNSNGASSSLIVQQTMRSPDAQTASAASATAIEASNHWFRMDLQDSAGDTTYAPRVDVAFQSNAGHSQNLADFLICFDTLIEGHSVVGWPLASDDATAQPDESLTLTAPDGDTHDTWTVLIHGVMPQTGFDARTLSDVDPLLCRLVVDGDNEVLVRLKQRPDDDPDTYQLIVSHISDGEAEATLQTFDNCFALCGSQVQIGLKYDGTNLKTWVSVGGMALASDSDTAPGALGEGPLASVVFDGDEMGWFGADVFQGTFVTDDDITGWLRGGGLFETQLDPQLIYRPADGFDLQIGDGAFADFAFGAASTAAIGITAGSNFRMILRHDPANDTPISGEAFEHYNQIDEAILVLTRTSAGSEAIDVVIDVLVEGEDDVVAEATWNSYSTGNARETAGGTIDPAASGVQATGQIGAAAGEYEIDVTAAYKWCLENERPFHVVIQHTGSPSEVATIGTSRRSSASQRPRVEVTKVSEQSETPSPPRRQHGRKVVALPGLGVYR